MVLCSRRGHGKLTALTSQLLGALQFGPRISPRVGRVDGEITRDHTEFKHRPSDYASVENVRSICPDQKDSSRFGTVEAQGGRQRMLISPRVGAGWVSRMG